MANVFQFICVCVCVGLVRSQFGFSHRDDRRYSSPIQYGLNLLSAPRRITERLTGVLQFRPENQNSNSQYIYPFRRPGISTENQQQYNNNPDPYGQNYGNYNQGGHQGYNNYPNYGYENNNPVAFPNSSPEGNGVNFVNNNNGQSVNVNDGSAVNFVNNDGQNTESNPPDHGTAVNFVDNSDGQYTESNPSSNGPNAPTYEETNQNNKYGYTQEGKEIEDPNVSFGQPENQNGFNNEPPLATGNNGIPNTPPLGIPSEPPAGIPNQPPAEIPNQPPAGIPSESPAGIPNQPPAGIPNVPPLEIPNTPPDSIPTVPPPGIPDVPPTFAPHPELPELTPVPETEKRNNFNFGSAGLFKENCQTVDQGLGSCISILQCQPYLALLKDSRTNPQATQILRKAHCGFEGNNPKVCCPLPGIPGTPPPAPTTTTTAAPPNPGPQNPTNVDPEDLVSALPEPPVCGNSSATLGRVVGGVKAKLGDFPWMALLGYKRGSSTRWLCGGSLISSKHVLTAAHCINGHEADLYLVRLGELDLESETEGATPVDVLIKYMIKHEDYSPTAFTNDIGILVLDKEMAFTELIRPICIPKDSELRARSFENYNPIIAGWGDTEFRGPSASHLQALQLPVVSNDFCASAYSSYKNQRIDERVLCAGFKAGGKDACQGDSGGPLMQPIWNNQDYTTQFFQIGVVSFGRKCAEAGFPGVYTRVTHFVPWIEQKVIGA